MFKNINPYKAGIVLALIFTAGFIPLCVLFYKFFTNHVEFSALEKTRSSFNILTLYTLVFYILGAITAYLLAFGRSKYLRKIEHKNNTITEEESTTTLAKQEEDVNSFSTFISNIQSSTDLENLLPKLYNILEAGIATCYLLKDNTINIFNTFGYTLEEDSKTSFYEGESIAFEAISKKMVIKLDDIPESFHEATSGLGSAQPTYLWYYPLKHKKKIIGVVEIGGFKPYSKEKGKLIDGCMEAISNQLEEIS